MSKGRRLPIKIIEKIQKIITERLVVIGRLVT